MASRGAKIMQLLQKESDNRLFGKRNTKKEKSENGDKTKLLNCSLEKGQEKVVLKENSCNCGLESTKIVSKVDAPTQPVTGQMEDYPSRKQTVSIVLLEPNVELPPESMVEKVRETSSSESTSSHLRPLKESSPQLEKQISQWDIGIKLDGQKHHLLIDAVNKVGEGDDFENNEDFGYGDPDSPPTPMYDSDADPEYLPSPHSDSNHSCDILNENLSKNSEEEFHNLNDEYIQHSRNQDMEKEEAGYFIDDGCPQSHHSVDEVQSNHPKLAKKNSKNHDHCIYCDENILNLNFARHLQRNHKDEIKVQKILSLPKMSKERKEIINDIRKKGNYILNSSKKCVRPVRKPNQSLDFDPNKYLPCIYCFGFFAKKQLWRHKKRCLKNISNSRFTTSDAQSFLVRNMEVDTKLRKVVFPHMAANTNSLAAKKDSLICAFGARYLRTHRGKHHIPVCSRKMQELAKLLIQMKILNPKIKCMIDALNPENYDTLVESTKKIAGYDEEKEVYRAPTYAMNIVKAVKDCCDIAMTFATKGKWLNNRSSQDVIETLKTYTHLLNANWKYDISSLASTNLQMNRWNKITIVPLAQDIKLLKDHLTNEGKNAAEKLKRNEDNTTAYRDLLEVVYCRVILLNRKRPGELERLSLAIYDQSKTRESYEEFEDAITPTEKVLASQFKRVVFVGKRHRGVPVLFPRDVQEHIKLIKKTRPNFFKGVKNPYLFGIPGKETPISGYKTLDKFAKSCGAINSGALKATKLRKHLATITQLFDMNDNEIEQLANFMGHTEGIHRGEHRLPDDVYQTAKICKLLLMMESGKVAQYKGMKLADINVDLDEDLLSIDGEDEENLEDIMNKHDDSLDTSFTSQQRTPVSSPQLIESKKHQKPKRELVPWTNEQKKIVVQFFKNHIMHKRPPKKNECEELLKLNKETLKNKSWLKIKVYVQNQYTKKK